MATWLSIALPRAARYQARALIIINTASASPLWCKSDEQAIANEDEGSILPVQSTGSDGGSWRTASYNSPVMPPRGSIARLISLSLIPHPDPQTFNIPASSLPAAWVHV